MCLDTCFTNNHSHNHSHSYRQPRPQPQPQPLASVVKKSASAVRKNVPVVKKNIPIVKKIAPTVKKIAPGASEPRDLAKRASEQSVSQQEMLSHAERHVKPCEPRPRPQPATAAATVASGADPKPAGIVRDWCFGSPRFSYQDKRNPAIFLNQNYGRHKTVSFCLPMRVAHAVAPQPGNFTHLLYISFS